MFPPNLWRWILSCGVSVTAAIAPGLLPLGAHAQSQSVLALLSTEGRSLAPGQEAAGALSSSDPRGPDDARLVGVSPPAGTEVGCTRLDREGREQRHGSWRQWFPDGTLRRSGHYRFGAKCGPWIERAAPDEPLKTVDHGPCPTVRGCQRDSDCEPPYSRCDEAYHRCVDGCYLIPCDAGEHCESTTGECVPQSTGGS